MYTRPRAPLRRSLLSALAAVLTAAVPMIPGTAFAEGPSAKSADAGASAKKAASSKKAKRVKHEMSADANEAQANEGKPTGKRTKKTASRASTKGKKRASRSAREKPRRPCYGAPITIDRTGIEGQTLPIVDCRGEPLASARAALSVLARPWGARKPEHLETRRDAHAKGEGRASQEVAPGVRLLDPGLLRRLDAVTHHFPGRPISVVSGYRPQSRGSQHQIGRALDFRVAGVKNEELVAFCKTLTDTGCGYYPNSSFVHMDVRNPGTGSVTWIDASGPGEGPHYVSSWPPPPDEAGPQGRDEAAHDGPTHDGPTHEPADPDDPWADLDAHDSR